MSPGPSFVFVVRASLASRPSGVAAALGMGVGGVAYGILALAGLRGLLEEVPRLHRILQLAGGLYLLLLAWRLWRQAQAPLQVDATAGHPRTLVRSFLWALGTQVSNPKTALVYASIFAALLPQTPSATLLVSLPFLIFVVEAGWYLVVATAFSSALPRAAYLRSKTWVDRAAAGCLGLLGALLLRRAAAQAE